MSSTTQQDQFECSKPTQGSSTESLQDNTINTITTTNQLGCIFQRLNQHDTIRHGSLVYIIHRSDGGVEAATTKTTIRITTSPPPTEVKAAPSSSLQDKNNERTEEASVLDEVVVLDGQEIPSHTIIEGMVYNDFELVSYEKQSERRDLDHSGVVNDQNGEGNKMSPVKENKTVINSTGESVVINSVYRRLPKSTR